MINLFQPKANVKTADGKNVNLDRSGLRGDLAVSVLATEPMGPAAAGSGPAEDGGFLRVIKIPSTHFLRRGNKAVGPMS
jgi:hypothetical protein